MQIQQQGVLLVKGFVRHIVGECAHHTIEQGSDREDESRVSNRVLLEQGQEDHRHHSEVKSKDKHKRFSAPKHLNNSEQQERECLDNHKNAKDSEPSGNNGSDHHHVEYLFGASVPIIKHIIWGNSLDIVEAEDVGDGTDDVSHCPLIQGARN